MLKCCCFPNVN